MIAEQEHTRAGAGTLEKPRTPVRRQAPGTGGGTVERVRQKTRDSRVRNAARLRSTPVGKRELGAVALISFAVTLLCLYIGAYARVTADGYAASRLTRDIRLAEAKGKELETQISTLHLPESIDKVAAELQMERTPPKAVQFLIEPPAQTGAVQTANEPSSSP
ncbi:MAG: hypothetical protein OHK0029_06850 [Armatimonadaceae bacterium]